MQKTDLRLFAAKFFSAVFVPLLIPIYSALLLVWSNKFAFGGWNWHGGAYMFLARIFVWTFLIPGMSVLILKKVELIKDVNMSDRKDRIIPYFVVIISYSIAFYAIRFMDIPPVIKAMVIGSLGSIILCFFLNNFFKISAHANGMGSFVGAMIGMLTISVKNVDYLIVVSILLTAAVCASRIYLKAHSMKELFWGFTIGLVTQILALLIFGVF